MRCRHRGAAAIATVVLLLILDLILIRIVIGGARDHDLTVRRVETIQAFYAAEAGMNMAIREQMNNTDEDGDGTVGTISDDGNPANDPTFGQAQVLVTSAVAGPQTTLTSQGRAVESRREIEAVLPNGAGTVTFGYPTIFASQQNNVEERQIAIQVTLSEPGTVQSITAYVKGVPTKKLRYAIYTDSSGEPGTLLAETAAEPVGSNSYHWHTISIPATSLNPGTYWLALAFEHRNVYYTYDASGGQTRYNDNDAVGNGFLANWGSSTTSNTRRVSIYAGGGIVRWQEVEPQ